MVSRIIQFLSMDHRGTFLLIQLLTIDQGGVHPLLNGIP